MRKLQREENGPQDSHFFHGMSRGLTRMDDSNDDDEMNEEEKGDGKTMNRK